MPDERDELPAADAVVVPPATFNTVNKRAAGITDKFASQIYAELAAISTDIPSGRIEDGRSRHRPGRR
jgi:phosphopantothenoylcysteine decarboxylase